MSYRNDVEALEARHAALQAEVATATKERDAAGQLLDEAKARAKLPVLDNLRVATPCTADWKQMTGDERVRACGACNKNVYNLSHMTRDEAEALLIEREGSLCVRYFQRADGTIILADCTIGKQQQRKRRVIAAGAAAMLAGGGGLIAYNASRSPPPFEKAVYVQDIAVMGSPLPLPVVAPFVPVPSPEHADHVEAVMGAMPAFPDPPPAPVVGKPKFNAHKGARR